MLLVNIIQLQNLQKWFKKKEYYEEKAKKNENNNYNNKRKERNDYNAAKVSGWNVEKFGWGLPIFIFSNNSKFIIIFTNKKKIFSKDFIIKKKYE